MEEQEWLVVESGAKVGRHLAGETGIELLTGPDVPEPVDIAVMHEEDRIGW